MRKIESSDVKNLNFLKHYRIVRKWACKTCDIKEADLELLIYLEAVNMFTKDDFKKGVYSFSWDNRRWNRLLKKEWIVVWRKRNRTTQKYHIYKVSRKCKLLINRIYKILCGEEEIPENTKSNIIFKEKTYTHKVLSYSIREINKEKRKPNGL